MFHHYYFPKINEYKENPIVKVFKVFLCFLATKSIVEHSSSSNFATK